MIVQPSTRRVKGWSLTAQQLAFVNGLVRGESTAGAYRQAYPNDQSNAANVSVTAYRLKRHPQISKILKDAEESIAERLVEDAALVQRYVLRELISLTKSAQREGTKIKALELLGKTFGFFEPRAETAPVMDPEKLKLDLNRLMVLHNVV
jgi:heme oxygenase